MSVLILGSLTTAHLGRRVDLSRSDFSLWPLLCENLPQSVGEFESPVSLIDLRESRGNLCQIKECVAPIHVLLSEETALSCGKGNSHNISKKINLMFRKNGLSKKQQPNEHRKRKREKNFRRKQRSYF